MIWSIVICLGRRPGPGKAGLRVKSLRVKSLGAKTCGLALLLGGCSLVPGYTRPNPAIPSAWSGPAAASLSNAVPAGGAWWSSFDSPELSSLIDRSLSGSFNLQAAVARIDEAKGTAEIAGSPLYPSITVAGVFVQSSGTKNVRTNELFAQASYEIDFWGKNHAIANSADSLVNATAFDAETVAQTLTASVADTYFQILSLQERVRLAQNIATDARRILSLIEAQREAGAATDLQVEQQRNAVATFDAAVPMLRQQLDQSLHLLAVLVGSTPEAFAGLGAKGLDGIAPPQIKADLPATVLRQRPDIRAAEARLISANFDIGAARAAFFPSIVLTGQAGITSQSLDHFFPAKALTDIAGSLLQPVFEGGLLQGQLRLDRARAIELTATYRQTVIAAFQDVEDALSAIEQLRRLAAIDVVAVDSGRKAADLANMQYRLGATDYLTVLTTERTLYQSEDALLQVRLQQLQAAVGLFRALGGGFGGPLLSTETGSSSARTNPFQQS